MAQSLQIEFSNVENPLRFAPLEGAVLMLLQKIKNEILSSHSVCAVEPGVDDILGEFLQRGGLSE